MKKLLISLITILIIIPIVVKAETINIKTSVNLDGKSLEKDEFSFVLKNQAGEIIQRKKNDINGDVLFDPVEVKTDEDESIYFIEEEKGNKEGYTYDDNKVYVRVVNNTSKVSYYKDGSVEKEMKEEVPIYKSKEPYHATEEELKGEAYGVVELSTKTLYFRRFDSLDTSSFECPFDSQECGNVDMAIDSDNDIIYYRNVESNRTQFLKAIGQSYTVDDNQVYINKVVFEEAIKPEFTDGRWLLGYPNVEYMDVSHLDTSNFTDMSNMFESAKIEKLDLSTFDTSKVTSMHGMFYNAKTKEIDMTSFSADSLTNTQGMFENAVNLTTLKISSKFNTTKLEDARYMFYNTPLLKLLDLSWFKIKDNTNLAMSFYSTGLKYIDISHWYLAHNKVTRTIDGTFNLRPETNIVYMDMSNLTSPECGAYFSNDFKFASPPKVVKTNPNYNFLYSSGGFTYYNVEANEFTKDFGQNGQCGYKYGGTYLNIQDESAGFTNLYKAKINVPDSIKLDVIKPVIITITITLAIISMLYINKRKRISNK